MRCATTHPLFYLQIEGVRNEIELDPETKYFVTRQWPLPKEQCDVIDDFFRAKHEAGMVLESNLHIRHRHFVSKRRTASGVMCMLITSLMRLLFRHRHPFLGGMFFKPTWLVVLCIAHSTWLMDITNCSCERVVFRLQQ